jgi:hypothetical protein
MCSCCGKRRALFYKKGKRLRSKDRVGYNIYHDLCPQCFEAALNRLHQEALQDKEEEEEEKECEVADGSYG